MIWGDELCWREAIRTFTSFRWFPNKGNAMSSLLKYCAVVRAFLWNEFSKRHCQRTIQCKLGIWLLCVSIWKDMYWFQYYSQFTCNFRSVVFFCVKKIESSLAHCLTPKFPKNNTAKLCTESCHYFQCDETTVRVSLQKFPGKISARAHDCKKPWTFLNRLQRRYIKRSTSKTGSQIHFWECLLFILLR